MACEEDLRNRSMLNIEANDSEAPLLNKRGLARRNRKLKSIVDYFNKVWPLFNKTAL